MRRKDKKHWKKKLNYEFIRISTSKEGYYADYEASRIQTFVSKFKDKKMKEKEKENTIKEKENTFKELKDEIEKLKVQFLLFKV